MDFPPRYSSPSCSNRALRPFLRVYPDIARTRFTLFCPRREKEARSEGKSMHAVIPFPYPASSATVTYSYYGDWRFHEETSFVFVQLRSKVAFLRAVINSGFLRRNVSYVFFFFFFFTPTENNGRVENVEMLQRDNCLGNDVGHTFVDLFYLESRSLHLRDNFSRFPLLFLIILFYKLLNLLNRFKGASNYFINLN